MHSLARFRAAVGIQQIDLLTARACSQNHAFADSELHFSRGEIGAQDDQPSDKIFRLVGALDACENVSRLLAPHAECQLQQFVRSGDCICGNDTRNTKIDLREFVDRAMPATNGRWRVARPSFHGVDGPGVE